MLCVQRKSLVMLRLGITDDTGPLQYASHSWILGCVPLDCVSQCAIDSFVSRSQSCGSRRVAFEQAFNSPPTSFAVSLLSPLTSSQVRAPRTTFTEAPSFEVCSAKVGPRHSVFHHHFSRGARHHLRKRFGMQCHCHPKPTEPASTVSLRQSGLWSVDVLAQPIPAARSMIPLDWLSSTGGLSGTVWLPSWRACAISLASASIAGSLSHQSVTLLYLSWSMNFAALFAIQGNQHGPRHLESPFLDDQHWSRLVV